MIGMAGTDSGKLSSLFRVSPLPEHPPGEGEALLVIAPLDVFQGVVISPEERERASLMKSMEAGNRFVAARRVVRGLFSKWSRIDPSEIPVCIDPGGKPFVAVEGMPSFSISHSGDLVAVLVAPGDAGIDLELERPVDASALARRFFSEEEALLVERSTDPSVFFQLWVCREAAIKADGRGMASLLEGMTTMREKEGGIRVSGGGREWRTIPWSISGGYLGAVAFPETPRVILWCDLR